MGFAPYFFAAAKKKKFKMPLRNISARERLVMRLAARQANPAVAMRQDAGLFITSDTKKDIDSFLKQSQSSPLHAVGTMIRSLGAMNAYSVEEFKEQIAQWIKLKCNLLKCNIWECPKLEGSPTLFVIQPPNLNDCDLCPISIACGKMVSGYGYLTYNKELVEQVWVSLGSKM